LDSTARRAIERACLTPLLRVEPDKNFAARLLQANTATSGGRRPEWCSVRSHFTLALPHKLASAARKRAGRRGLSSFVARAVARELEREP
jgi:hypothetical protein